VPKLVTTRGPTRGREYELEEICILGRSPSCQIYIGDLTVSRQHARIVRTDRGFVLEDLGSGNGTWVNESRVSQHLLQNNDEVRISESVFRFVEEAKPEGRWVNMVTVIAGNEPGLISTQTEPRIKFFDTQVDLSEEDLIRAMLSTASSLLRNVSAPQDNDLWSTLQDEGLATATVDPAAKLGRPAWSVWADLHGNPKVLVDPSPTSDYSKYFGAQSSPCLPANVSASVL